MLIKVACEALIAAASKKDKCRSILSQGTNILKELYKSSSDAVKVRALIGLCKLGSLGGTDASMKPFSEGASLKLAEACRRLEVKILFLFYSRCLLEKEQNKSYERIISGVCS